MKKYTLILSIFIGMTISSHAQWIEQNSGTSQWINSVYFIDENIGYAVGDYGVIRKTVDGGTNWISQSGTMNDFLSVFFTDMNTGYIVGYSGTILKTTNAGANWSLQTSGTNSILHSVYFTDANTGFAVGDTGIIIKTINGGVSWTQQVSNTIQHLQCVYFSDTNHGYAVGGQYSGNGVCVILKTINSGADWTVEYGSTGTYFMSVYSHENNAACVVGQNGKILKATSDQPGIWQEMISGVVIDLNSVAFYQNIGFAVGNSGLILKTTDYGSTWTPQYSGTSNDLLSVFIVNGTTAYIGGVDGTILKTTNGGVGINEPSVGENVVRIYPNPATNIITINIENSINDASTLYIYNALGDLVKIENIKQNQPQFNIADLCNGIYMVIVKSQEFTVNQKLLIQR